MPGGPGYELSYSVTGILEYLLLISPIPASPASISPSTYTDPRTSEALQAAFDAIAKHEQTLIRPLLDFLTSPRARARGVRIVGEETLGDRRVPTISFVVVDDDENASKAMKSKDVVKLFDDKGDVRHLLFVLLPSIFKYFFRSRFRFQIGIRYGHFYAYTLVDHLEPKLDTEDSVVRISLVHYNTVEEVHRIIQVLEEALGV
jgi:selenocysteine lyase/cysteine desulfurase